MRYKRIMLVALVLLAILTIGAVSASDNMDGLAVSNETVSSSANDVIVSYEEDDGGSDDGILKDGEELRDMEIDFKFPSSIVKNGGYEDGYSIPLPYDFEGQVTFKVNDTVEYDEYCYGYSEEFYLNDLDYGTYSWQLNCVDDSGNYNPLTLDGTLEVTYLKYNIPEQVVLGSDDHIGVWYSSGVYGTFTVLINGEEYAVRSINDNDENYLSISLFDLPVGKYNYEFIYSGYRNYKGFHINGSFDVDYLFDDLYLDEYEVTYGGDATICAYVPVDLTGKITAVVNGKAFNFDVSDTGDNYGNYPVELKLSNFKLGENIITITHCGNEKYPGKSFNITVNAIAKINYEYSMAYTDAYVSLILPQTAQGNLIVKINDEDFASVAGKNGVFNVSLDALSLGSYALEAIYDGEDFEVASVGDPVSIVPKFTVPDIVGFYEGALISIEIPEDVEGEFCIYKRDPWDWDGEDESLTLINATEVINGKASILLTSFRNTYYYDDDFEQPNSFVLAFENENYKYSESYHPNLRFFERNTDFSVDVPEIVIKDKVLFCIPNDEISRSYDVYIDGDYKGKYHNHRYAWDDLEEEYIEINVTGLGYGKHKIEFRYVDEEGFYDSINKTYFFNVSYILFNIPAEIIDANSIDINFEDNLTGNVTLFLNGNAYSNLNLQKYSNEGSFYIDSLDYGTYECEVVYSGDANHGKITKEGSFNFSYPIFLTQFSEGEIISVNYGENYDITVGLPGDVTGNVTVTVNGKKFTAKAHDYTDFTIDNFAPARNKFTVTYEGDSKYPSKTIVMECDACFDIILDNDIVYLALPSDATGNLVVEVDDEEFKTVKFVDGMARVKLDNLQMGVHDIYASYDGDDYDVEKVALTYYTYNITAPKKVGIDEGAVITINSPIKFNGELIIEHMVSVYDDEFYDWVTDYIVVNSTNIVNGFGSVNLTTFDGFIYEDDYEDSEEHFNDYRIVIKTDEGTEYSMGYYPKVIKASSNFGLYLDVQKELLKYEYLDVFTNAPESGYVNVYVDGKYYKRFYGDIGIDISDLDYGTHTIDAFYSGNEYYAAQNASATFDITYMQVLTPVMEIIEDGSCPELVIEMDSDATGYVTVNVDGETVLIDFVSDYVHVELPGLTVGNHTYEVTYSGDGKFSQLTKKGTFVGKYYGEVFSSWSYEGETAVITANVVNDATGSVELTIDGKKYTQNVVNGSAKFLIENLTEGDYPIAAKYMGDDKYPSYVISNDEMLSILSKRTSYYINVDDYHINYGDDVLVNIELPADAVGFLVVNVDDNFYGESQLVNGKAQVVISNLTYGDHIVNSYYESYNSEPVDYKVYNDQSEISVTPVIADSDSYNIVGSEIIIPIELAGDANGNLEVYNDEKLLTTQKVTNGKVMLNLTDKLGIGANSLTIKYNDGKYKLEDYFYQFVLPNVTFPRAIVVGDDSQATFTFPENFNGKLVVYFQGTDINVTKTLVNGKTAVSLSDLPAGRVFMRFVYDDGENYFNSYGYYSYDLNYIDILRHETDVSVSNSNQTTKVKFDNADVSGTVIAKIDGKYYVSEIANGEAIFDAVGNNVSISYSGDGNYEMFKDKAVNITEELDLFDIGLEVNVEDIDVGEMAVVSIKTNSTFTGNVTVSIDKKEYTVNVQNGKGNVSIADLAADTYNVTAKFAGNSVFDRSANATSFKVNKLIPAITVNAADSIVEQSDLTAEIAIPGATGVVIINGKEYALVNGTANISIPDVKIGTVDINVSYAGDDKYLNASATKSVTVFAKTNPNLVATVENIKVGETAIVNISINENVTGQVYVNGKPVTIVNGKGNSSIEGLAAGEFIANVTFAGDEYFDADEKTVSFKVDKVESTPESNPFNFADNETVESKTPTYSIELEKDATGNLTVTVGNKTYTKELVNGSASIEITDLPAGSYDVVVAYSGDDKYAASVKTSKATVKVDPKIVAKDLSVQYYAGKYYSVTVYGDDGNVSANTEVVFILNGKQIAKAITNENGVAKFKVKQTPVTKGVIVSSALGVNATAKLTVKRVITLKKVTVKKSAKKLVLTATLKKVNGKYLKGKKITFKFNGKKVKTVKTNKKGVAKVTVKSSVLKKLKVGKKVTYTAKYVKDTVKQKVKVKK